MTPLYHEPGRMVAPGGTSSRVRILFVDDEPMILAGLRSMLRRERRTWDMQFAESGPEALALMQQQAADVVVTDLRMPGMDGAELLQEVQERHPATVRIILSGYSELEAGLRALPVAHQFVSKPCPAEQLRQVVERACNLNQLLADEELRRTISSMKQLPMLSSTYVELSAAMADPDNGASEIAAIIERDPGIAARVLQLVNSGFFGLEREIHSVHRAIAYLGFDVIRSLVLLNDTIAGFRDSAGGKATGLATMRRHALLVGLIARKMYSQASPADNAFTAGLLHDIGKLVLAAIGAEGDHAAAGAYLLGLWGLPYPIVEAVAHHHSPWAVNDRDFDLPASTYLANWLAHSHVGSKDETPEIDRLFVGRVVSDETLDSWHILAEEYSTRVARGA